MILREKLRDYDLEEQEKQEEPKTKKEKIK